MGLLKKSASKNLEKLTQKTHSWNHILNEKYESKTAILQPKVIWAKTPLRPIHDKVKDFLMFDL